MRAAHWREAVSALTPLQPLSVLLLRESHKPHKTAAVLLEAKA